MLDLWLNFMNMGHRITAVGVSDVHGLDAPGRDRTYVEADDDRPSAFDEDAFVEAVKGGRAVVSKGAFARVFVNDSATCGDTITDTDAEVDVHVIIEAIPEIDVTYYEVFANCDRVLSVLTSDPGAVVKVDEHRSLTLAADAHLVVLAYGSQDMPRGFSNYDAAGKPRLVTNPIYVDVDGNGVFDPPGGKPCSYALESPPEM